MTDFELEQQKQVDFAATILDKEKPNWFKIINFDNLSMMSTNKCILGQLYGHYSDAYKTLKSKFNNLSCEPFCYSEYIPMWKNAVQSRLNKSMSYSLAMARCINENIRVCRPHWSKAIYVEYDAARQDVKVVNGGCGHKEEDFKARDWRVWEDNKRKFKDIEIGQMFTFNNAFYVKISEVKLGDWFSANAIKAYENRLAVSFTPEIDCFLT